MEYKKTPVWKRIQTHAVVMLIIILSINTTISNLLINAIEMTNIELGILGIYINNFMNIVITTILIVLFMSYYILKPIQKMEKTIHEFESGNAEVRVQTRVANEIGMLATRLNVMFDRISEHQTNQQDQINLVENKSNAISEQMETLTGEINDVNLHFEDIANEAIEQLSSFEETTAVTDTMNNQFQSITSSVLEVTSSFNDMKKQTESGGLKIKDASQSMENISIDSKKANDVVTQLTNEISKIKDVVTLINDISEQTNLLALNASIEAARAGEHGKGFSIVAEEVRKLAERSVGATKQITTTVESILQDVGLFSKNSDDLASTIANEATKILAINQAFEDLATNIVTNVKIFDSISSHTKEVSQSSLEIASAMEQATSKTENTTENVIRMNKVLTDQLAKTEKVSQEVAELQASFSK